MDDDDLFLPDHLSTLFKALTENEDARLAYARSTSIDSSKATQTEFGAKFKPWRQLDTGFFHSQAALFARSLIAESARFDPDFEILEDMDFFVQCAQRTRFAYVERVTSVSYRDAGTSETGTQRDANRINDAISKLRTKWSVLELQLRSTPEFRLEHALWEIDHGSLAKANALLRSVSAERPDWPDAIAVAAMLDVRRNNLSALTRTLDILNDREPWDLDLRTRLATLRAQFAAQKKKWSNPEF